MSFFKNGGLGVKQVLSWGLVPDGRGRYKERVKEDEYEGHIM
jgi:hypothetical protein